MSLTGPFFSNFVRCNSDEVFAKGLLRKNNVAFDYDLIGRSDTLCWH
jgi:hypothetical protein